MIIISLFVLIQAVRVKFCNTVSISTNNDVTIAIIVIITIAVISTIDNLYCWYC